MDTDTVEKPVFVRYSKLHLTMTGYYAGKPLCNFNMDKEAAKTQNEGFVHAMYANLNHPDICLECKQVWEDEEE